jgi:transposase
MGKKEGYRKNESKAKEIYTLSQNGIPTLLEYSVVLAMGGVGDKLAPRVIAEIGDVRHFHSKNALIANAGIDTPPYQSGACCQLFNCLNCIFTLFYS